jgi:hypothetical protein
MNLTKDERILRHKQFLSTNWEMLAAFSWEHYQQEGRGAVLVVEEDFVHAETPQYTTVHLRYVSDASPVLKDIGGWPGGEGSGLGENLRSGCASRGADRQRQRWDKRIHDWRSDEAIHGVRQAAGEEELVTTARQKPSDLDSEPLRKSDHFVVEHTSDARFDFRDPGAVAGQRVPSGDQGERSGATRRRPTDFEIHPGWG